MRQLWLIFFKIHHGHIIVNVVPLKSIRNKQNKMCVKFLWHYDFIIDVMSTEVKNK